jgi:hypothetical protein
VTEDLALRLGEVMGGLLVRGGGVGGKGGGEVMGGLLVRGGGIREARCMGTW